MVFKLGTDGEVSIFLILADARYTWCRLRQLNDDSESCQFEIIRVGCELKFNPLLATETNYDSAFCNDHCPGERSYGPRYWLYSSGDRRRTDKEEVRVK